MGFVRRRIETQVMSLTGLSLGKIDLENPRGDPGLFGPSSICWQVHGDYSSMLIGGIRALMLQALHPFALAGAWDHSNFREDMIGRLRRTGLFISGTTFGSRQDAERLIEKVRSIHLLIIGTALDGRPYAASDPDLLTWVHVGEVSSFLSAHLRYKNPQVEATDWPLIGSLNAYGRFLPIARQAGLYRFLPVTTDLNQLKAALVPFVRPSLRRFCLPSNFDVISEPTTTHCAPNSIVQ